MPPPRHHAHSDFSGQPPQWMKFAFPFMCAVLVVVAFFGWEQWEDANRDYATKERELRAKLEQNDKLKRDVDNVVDFLQKYNKDLEFRMRMARQRTGGAAPGEIILQIDPPPASRGTDTTRNR